MPTLEAIETKIKRLQEQAEAIKTKQASATLERIVELMQKSGVTVADIEAHLGGKKRGARPGKSAAARTATVTAKYRHPKSGATWSGRGRAPTWIANAKNRDRFLVDGNAMSTSTSAGGKAKRKGNYVRGQQPAKYRDPKTGTTWSGRGRAPAWIANAKDRSRFSIAADEKVEATVKTTLRKVKGKASSTAVSPGRKGQPKGKQPAKYLNPETGATWSGRGPAPAWLAAASDRSKFLIGAAAIETPTA
ncbi:histone family protein nucleoid-structuring protein H-NS [Burkholderia pseudomallei]|uniref:H-NS family nucleoid-associated regulatory protein n=1 Tax=Burkholderia pseudomallei TaxID=28450 RepID=UPI000F07F1CA|nr:H-NS family nucleoid-associated regulatory protein [Burkholderia pseudomallei]CAJ7238417.1 histone family protein nucleoid-structuring protein H-NS [Burkholderia pseudomallei]VBC15435.1 histone family protein nucleoid-structuring protein H-NS [Burkholderia pseudomallei]VBS98740.1 histone family protein nucleoid-structuring protein H-NS [Burkholderia pseudomallei]